MKIAGWKALGILCLLQIRKQWRFKKTPCLQYNRAGRFDSLIINYLNENSNLQPWHRK